MIGALRENLVIVLTPLLLSAEIEYKQYHGLLRTATLVEEYAKLSLRAAEGFPYSHSIDVCQYFSQYTLEHLRRKYFKDGKSSFDCK